MSLFGIAGKGDKATGQKATNLSLEEAFEAMERSIKVLKNDNKVLQPHVLENIEQAAQEAKVIGNSKDAIVNGIVHPVTSELKRGATLGWIGLILGVMGLLQTDLGNQQTILAKLWNAARPAFAQTELSEKEKALLGDFYTSTQSVSSKAEFSAVTVRLADAMKDAEGGEGQARALLEEIGKKYLADEKNTHYRWLRNYAHVVAQWHVRRDRAGAAELARQFLAEQKDDVAYSPFIRLYALGNAAAEARAKQLPVLEAIRLPAETSQLEFIGPEGRREKWSDALAAMKRDGALAAFANEKQKIVVVNDTTGGPSGQGRAMAALLRTALGLPEAQLYATYENLDKAGPEQVTLIARTPELHKAIGGHVQAVFAARNEVVRLDTVNLAAATQKTVVLEKAARLMRIDPAIAVIVRVRGERTAPAK